MIKVSMQSARNLLQRLANSYSLKSILHVLSLNFPMKRERRKARRKQIAVDEIVMRAIFQRSKEKKNGLLILKGPET